MGTKIPQNRKVTKDADKPPSIWVDVAWYTGFLIVLTWLLAKILGL